MINALNQLPWNILDPFSDQDFPAPCSSPYYKSFDMTNSSLDHLQNMVVTLLGVNHDENEYWHQFRKRGKHCRLLKFRLGKCPRQTSRAHSMPFLTGLPLLPRDTHYCKRYDIWNTNWVVSFLLFLLICISPLNSKKVQTKEKYIGSTLMS